MQHGNSKAVSPTRRRETACTHILVVFRELAVASDHGGAVPALDFTHMGRT